MLIFMLEEFPSHCIRYFFVLLIHVLNYMTINTKNNYLVHIMNIYV